MTVLRESSTPPTTGFPSTILSLAILVDVGAEAVVTDHIGLLDVVTVAFELGTGHRAVIQGDLTNVQRLVDDIAHQLALVSAMRGAREEDEQARGKANVEILRGAVERARAAAGEAV